MYVYHATIKQNQESIKKNGLLLNKGKYNNSNYYVENQLFFTWLSPREAHSIVFCMCNEIPELKNIKESDIIVYAVDIDNMDIKAVKYDYNYKCESFEEIKTFAYTKPIPPEFLILIDPADYCKNEFCNGNLLKSNSKVAQEVGEKLEDVFEEKIQWLYEN